MNDKTTQRDLTKFFLIAFLLLVTLFGLKMYDTKTNEVDKLGTKIFSKFLNI